jgi:L-threonylcarbamoyladenylate synthase
VVTHSAEFYKKAPPQKGASSFVYPPTGDNLAFFAEALKAGCLVAIPTETVYGLAGLALDQAASRSIFDVKGRPLMDPLILHVANPSMVDQLAEIPDGFSRLTEAFWPGPLTIILPKKPVVPDIVTAAKPTVAVRMPRHPVAHALLELVGQPLAAPSANPFGYVSPSTAQHVTDSFGESVPFVIDGGACEIGLESTILDLSHPDSPEVLRPGAISAEQLGKVLGRTVAVRIKQLDPDQAATAPGTFSKHYSPKTSLTLFCGDEGPSPSNSQAVVYLQRPPSVSDKHTYWLSENGDMETVAKSLFALLRQLDAMGYETIACQKPHPLSGGMAQAVADRLQRAAEK